MHDITRILGLLLIVLALPLTSTIQAHAAQPATDPNPILNIQLSNFQRFTNTISRDFQPAIIQGLDGTAWVFWEYVYFNGHSALPVIDYRTSTSPSPVYNASAWSGNQVLSQTPLSQNTSPSASQFRNGTMYVSFASNRTGSYNIFLKKYNPGTGWSGDQQATLSTLDQIGSSVVAAKDNSLWLFYDRNIDTTTANIYYRVASGGSWSTETALTNNGTGIQNTQPSAYQMNDGSIWIVWTRTDSSTGVGNIYYKRFSAGVWSSAVQLSNSVNGDTHPAIIQDSNTTIWVAFSRDLTVSGSLSQFDIFYNYSVNNGTSWAGETNLTNDVGCSTVCPEDMNPNFAQMKDGRVYLFWTSNRDPQNYWNLYYATTNPMPFHHIAVTALSAGPVLLRMGDVPVTINLTVTNFGTFPETFWLFVKAVNTTASTVALQYLTLGANQTMPLSIIWNTAGMRPAKYLMTANVVPGQNENQIVTGDNMRTGGREWLVPPGDVDYDGSDDVSDLGIVALAYHSTPGSPNWNPQADLNHNGEVGIDDLSIVALWYHTYT